MIDHEINCESWASFIKDASGDIRRLDDVTRFSSIPVVFRETVSMHSFWVAIYSFMIHSRLRGPGELSTFLLVHALTHDAVECLSGDFVRTFKYSSEDLKREIEKAEEQSARNLPHVIHSMVKFTKILPNDRREYVEKVVKAADFLSLHQYMCRERRRGNDDCKLFFDRMEEDIERQAYKLFSTKKPLDKSLSNLYYSMLNWDSEPEYTR